MGFLEVFVSPRPGEVRWQDLRLVMAPDGSSIEVVVFARNAPPLRTTVHLTSRWAGGGWHQQIECPQCKRPTSILRLKNEELACQRCKPHRTKHQLEHKSRSWNRLGGKQADEIVRLVLDDDEPLERLLVANKLGRELTEADVAHVREHDRRVRDVLQIMETER
jgi:hypothetical protein